MPIGIVNVRVHALDVVHVLKHAECGHVPRVCAKPRDGQVPRELELVRQLGPILSERLAHLQFHAVGQEMALREHVADDATWVLEGVQDVLELAAWRTVLANVEVDEARAGKVLREVHERRLLTVGRRQARPKQDEGAHVVGRAHVTNDELALRQ